MGRGLGDWDVGRGTCVWRGTPGLGCGDVGTWERGDVGTWGRGDGTWGCANKD